MQVNSTWNCELKIKMDKITKFGPTDLLNKIFGLALNEIMFILLSRRQGDQINQKITINR